jgi:cytochrome c oxidase assembly protein subunit 11
MVALSFAAVPLYQLFCQVTGFGGTTQRAEAVAGPVLERTMKVRFDGNVGNGCVGVQAGRPPDRAQGRRAGEGTYRATNVSDRPTTGTATFNVSPSLAGAYFVKIECFCFTEQTLAPGESVDMPVMFYIDPEIADDATWPSSAPSRCPTPSIRWSSRRGFPRPTPPPRNGPTATVNRS